MLPFIAGTGAYAPETRIPSEAFLRHLQPRSPTGTLVPEDWVRRYFGIETRAFDYSLAAHRKPTPEEGGVFDNDLAERAGLRAIAMAGRPPTSIGTLIHCSATPGELHFQNHLGLLADRLAIPSDAQLLHLDLGCAALAAALPCAAAHLAADPDKDVLVLVSQCTSAFAHSQSVLQRYVNHPDPWAWLGASVFADGGGALLIRASTPREVGRGIVHSWQATRGRATPLIRHALGGSDAPITRENLDLCLYTNDAPRVGLTFVEVMEELHLRLKRDWKAKVEPFTGRPFSNDAVARWYLHQSNKVKVDEARHRLGLPSERVPTNVEHLGNTSGPSTLLLLDADLRSGAVGPGDLVVFFLVGGGNGGTHYGYSVVVL